MIDARYTDLGRFEMPWHPEEFLKRDSIFDLTTGYISRSSASRGWGAWDVPGGYLGYTRMLCHHVGIYDGKVSITLDRHMTFPGLAFRGTNNYIHMDGPGEGPDAIGSQAIMTVSDQPGTKVWSGMLPVKERNMGLPMTEELLGPGFVLEPQRVYLLQPNCPYLSMTQQVLVMRTFLRISFYTIEHIQRLSRIAQPALGYV